MRLTDYFMELFAYIVYFSKSAHARQPAYEKVRTDIERMMTESELCIKENACSQEDYDDARFAVAAWVDEMILRSAWKEKNRWQREKLQFVYFRTADAGELFFEKLNNLGPHQMDVREVYYFCLSLGYMGQYDDMILTGLKTSNLKLLTGSSVALPTLEKDNMFTEAYSARAAVVGGPKPSGLRVHLFTLFCFVFPVLFGGALFWIYRYILGTIGV